MLTLEQYGVKLSRLQAEDLELVRRWRNDPEIARYMQFRGFISEEEQKKWFLRIDNRFNYYFIIEFEGKKIGLINAKDYDPAKGYGEGGIFIWDEEHRDSYVPVLATLTLMNFCFFALRMKKSVARVLRTNKRAIYYNTLIGYKCLPGQDDVVNQLYELTAEDYYVQSAKLNRAATALCEGKEIPHYSGTVCDKNLDEINDLIGTQGAR